MSAAALAWIDGRWGTPLELGLPLQDRGLQLADGLFETVLVEAGAPRLLEAHLQRWNRSAAWLAMAPPPAQQELEPLIAEAVARTGAGPAALRLNWSRGDGAGRGIDLPPPAAAGDAPANGHRFWLLFSPCTPAFNSQTAWISRQERRNADSRLSHCKTFAYGQSIQVRREARAAGADEGLLLSTDGSLCCGATANLLVQQHGRWLTPPLRSGCLPGVMRGRALAQGLAVEAELAPSPDPQDRWLLINSLGCRPLVAVDGLPLEPLSGAEAEGLWRGLL